MRFLARAYGGYLIVAAIALFSSVLLDVYEKYISGFDDVFENILMANPHGLLIIAAGLIIILAGAVAVYDGFKTKRAAVSAFGFFSVFMGVVFLVFRVCHADQLDWGLTIVYTNIVVGAFVIAALIKDGYNNAPRVAAMDALLLAVMEVVFVFAYTGHISTGYFYYAIVLVIAVVGVAAVCSEARYMRFVVRQERIDLVTEPEVIPEVTARDAIRAADEQYLAERMEEAKKAALQAAADADAEDQAVADKEKAKQDAEAAAAAQAAAAQAAAAQAAADAKSIADAVEKICDACFERKLTLRRTDGSDGLNIVFDDVKLGVCVFTDTKQIPTKDGWVVIAFKCDEVSDGKKEAEVIIDYLAEMTPVEEEEPAPVPEPAAPETIYIDQDFTNADLGIEPETVETPVRRALYNRGYRFRRSYGPHKIPIAFVSTKIAVFVTDGKADKSRDKDILADGWTIIRFDGKNVTDGEAEADVVVQAVKEATRAIKKEKAKKARAKKK